MLNDMRKAESTDKFLKNWRQMIFERNMALALSMAIGTCQPIHTSSKFHLSKVFYQHFGCNNCCDMRNYDDDNSDRSSFGGGGDSRSGIKTFKAQ